MATLSFPSPTQLKNISDPSVSSDAATKKYVDDTIASGGGQLSLSATVDEFTGDGTTVAFTLTATPQSKNFTFAVVQGLMQPKSSYSVSGTTLTFSQAPPNGALVEVTTMGMA